MFFFVFILFAGLTILCLVLFVISVGYFVGGIKTYRMGRREKARNVAVTGLTVMVVSFAGMLSCFALWYWLCLRLLYWEL
jgi:hypothetical protein